jgi:hypothetical protein
MVSFIPDSTRGRSSTLARGSAAHARNSTLYLSLVVTDANVHSHFRVFFFGCGCVWYFRADGPMEGMSPRALLPRLPLPCLLLSVIQPLDFLCCSIPPIFVGVTRY